MSQEFDESLLSNIQHEFDCAADYIWKAPRLIEHETKLERKKLKAYFPDRPDLAESRWRREARKLNATFPYMIAVGNLFSAASLYETYLLLLANIIDKRFGKLKTCHGQGQSRIHSFLKLIGISYSNLETYAAVEAAISIRNCLMHCNGVLDWSRDSLKLRDLVARGRYLSKEHRDRRFQIGLGFDEVSIIVSPFGDKLRIDNSYAHLAAHYFRDHLLLLARGALRQSEVGAKNSFEPGPLCDAVKLGG